MNNNENNQDHFDNQPQSFERQLIVEPIQIETETEKDQQPQQRQKVEYYVTRKLPNKKGETTENAVAKVKITHLELPFGNADGKTADDALGILSKMSKKQKSKIKIIRGKTGGFTLSGLPSSLSEREINQVAKGLASVMGPKKKRKNKQQKLELVKTDKKKQTKKKKASKQMFGSSDAVKAEHSPGEEEHKNEAIEEDETLSSTSLEAAIQKLKSSSDQTSLVDNASENKIPITSLGASAGAKPPFGSLAAPGDELKAGEVKEPESVNPAVLAHPAEAAATETQTEQMSEESGALPALPSADAAKPGIQPPAEKEPESVNPAVLAHPAEAAATGTQPEKVSEESGALPALPSADAAKPGIQPPAEKEPESVNPAVLAHPAEAAATGTQPEKVSEESGALPALPSADAAKPGIKPPAEKESESVNPAVLAHPAEAAATETQTEQMSEESGALPALPSADAAKPGIQPPAEKEPESVNPAVLAHPAEAAATGTQPEKVSEESGALPALPSADAAKPGIQPPAEKEPESVNPAVLAHPAEAAATGTQPEKVSEESGALPALPSADAAKPGIQPPAEKEPESVNPAVLAHPAEAAATGTQPEKVSEDRLDLQERQSPEDQNIPNVPANKMIHALLTAESNDKGQLGKIPMSHSAFHPEVAQASPWHTWNHLVQEGLISANQPGGGSHRGVGLPDHGHGSMVTPLTHKEPLIESITVLGNAMDVRPKNAAAAQSDDTPVTAEASPQDAVNSAQDSVYLGGDSIGKPVSDTIPGSLVGVGNEQPAREVKAPATTTDVTQTGERLLDLAGVSGASSNQGEKSLEISKLSDFDILDVDLQGVNSMKREYLDQGTELRGKTFGVKM